MSKSDFSPRIEEAETRDGELIVTWLEKMLPPVLTYVTRKLDLIIILLLLKTAKVLGKPYGLKIDAEVSDRSAWCWMQDLSLPRFIIKRVN